MEFLTLTPLWWLLLLPVMLGVFWFTLADRPPAMRWISFSLRVVALVLIILAMCRPFFTDESDEVHVAFLVDGSESVSPQSMKNAAASIRSAIDKLGPDDGHSLFLFGSGLREVTLEELDEFIENCEQGGRDSEFRAETDLAAAMSGARFSFPAEKGRRLVVLTDGVPTRMRSGIMDQLEKEKTDVQWVRLPPLDVPEASVVSFESPSKLAFQGEVVRLRVKLFSNKDMKGKLRILHRGVAVAEQEVVMKGGEEAEALADVEMVTAGDSFWKAELVPDEDHFLNNNQAGLSLTVKGKPRILVVHEESRQMREAKRALERQGIELDLRGSVGLPDSLQGMLQFDAIVLADIAAPSIRPDQMNWLKRYVTDFGGGLVMLGSENSFGLGGYHKTPIEEVLPLVSRFEKEKEKPSMAMILVIDKSGSMSGAPIALARQAARAAAELLSARDQISVIGFDSAPQVVCELTSAGNKDVVEASIDSLAAGGGTNLYPAMVQAREILNGTAAKIKHIIALTDGQTPQADNLGLTQELADAGVTISTVALGTGAARELLAAMAETGRGRYYETTSPETVPQIFTRETMQASKSAIKEDLYASVQVNDHIMISGYEKAELPFSLGYVMTRAKPTAQVVLASESGDPLLAVGRFGLGTGVAYTSDLTERWGAEWISWSEFGKFWAQVLRSALKKEDAIGMDVKSSVERDLWTLNITRVDEAGRPVSGIDWNAEALDENGESREVEIEEVGLGTYTAKVSAAGANRMALSLQDRTYGKVKTIQWTRSYPAEYRFSNSEAAELKDLTQMTPDTVKDGIERVRVRKSAIPWFGFAALALIMGSVIMRRI